MYVIGIVLKPQGLKGEIKVKSISPYPERFKLLNKIFVKKEKIQAYSIQSVRVSDKFVFLKFNEINNREQAEDLRDCEILIEKSDLLELKDQEYYIHDLIGCQVCTNDGQDIGELVQVSQFSSNDVYVVKNNQGKEILIPAISEVIRQIDLEKKIITIQLLEGLLD